MYQQDKTTNNCGCIKAIPICKPEKTIIKSRGIKPKKKNNSKPAKIFNYMSLSYPNYVEYLGLFYFLPPLFL